MSNKQLLLLGAGASAVVVGALYFASMRAKKALEKITAPISGGIAATIDYATAEPEMEATWRVVLPNGNRVSGDLIQVKSDFTFTHQGSRYRVTTRRPDNDYDSVNA